MKTITIDDNQNILELMRHIFNKIDPSGEHFFADTAADGLQIIDREHIRIVFLDIEMPVISGDHAAEYLIEKYGKIDIIFITGHSEYAMLGHKLHCAAFVTKPFDETDILESLEYLRLPLESKKILKVRCDGQFTVTAHGEPLQFKRQMTYELLTYLLYKNGVMVILARFWHG